MSFSWSQWIRVSVAVLAPVLAAASVAACGDHGGTPSPSWSEPATRSGGSGGSSSSQTESDERLPCDVAQTLHTSCTKCHGKTPSFGAPMSLLTLGDLHADAPSDPSKKVYELVTQRTHDTNRPMPQPPNARLSDGALSMLDTWVAAGAPGKKSTCAPLAEDEQGGPKALSCTPDQKMRPLHPIKVAPGTDTYFCYGFDVEVASKRHVIALGPKPDNAALVHHLLLFQIPNALSAEAAPCSFKREDWRLVSGWAPGGGNLELPQEAGFPEEGTTHWALEIHYRNPKNIDSQVDNTGYDMCSTDQLRANDADVMATGSMAFTIPAHSDYQLDCSFKYPLDYPKLHVFSASPHMHNFGREMRTEISGRVLVHQPSYDFLNQYAMPANAEILPGDNLGTRCRWKNDSDNAVPWGEELGTEMCNDYITYYPKIAASGWNWHTPARSATCTPNEGHKGGGDK